MSLKTGIKISIALILVLVTTVCYGVPNNAFSDQNTVQKRVQKIIAQVDSDRFMKRVSVDELIVKAFRVLLERRPDAYEFYCLKSLHLKESVKYSQILGLIIAEEDTQISWEKSRQLLKGNLIEKMNDNSDIKEDVQNLKRETPANIVKAYQRKIEKSRKSSHSNSQNSFAKSGDNNLMIAATEKATTLPYESYNTYFGYLHAHCSLSDGKGSPEEAYQYARDIGKLDFFGLSDHGEMLCIWPWENKWDKLKNAAQSYNAPGTFATLWGFEWSNPLNGHCCVFNTSDFTHCLADVGIGDLYNWIEDRPNAFGTFNHPGDYDAIMIEFMHLDVSSPECIPQMVGIENLNGSGDFDTYYYKNRWALCTKSYMDTGNLKGWRLGSLSAQDNHEKDWGTKNQFVTAVMAKSLTREEIIAAYRGRRFYASEDRDLVLDFRCSGYPMGSQLTGISRSFTVSATDRSGDTFSQVRLYRNGDLIAAQAVSGNDPYVTFTDYDTTSPAYYYVIVTQSDDNDASGRNDEAISSPIWLQ